MMTILKLTAILILGLVLVFLLKKLTQCLINLVVLYKKENYLDISKQRDGIVYNTTTKKLEADQSIILPFE